MKKCILLTKITILKYNQLGAPQKMTPILELLLNNLEKDQFSLLPGKADRYSFNRCKWKAMRNLAEYRLIITKIGHKGSCVLVVDHQDYFVEAEKQLSYAVIYDKVNFS